MLVVNMSPYAMQTRLISWIRAARKDFETFPRQVQGDALDALAIAAEGGKSDNAKPFKAGSGVYLKLR